IFPIRLGFVQERPLDLTMATLKRRSRRCPVPIMTDNGPTPIDPTLANKRQPRQIKRPRRDADYVTGDDLDDPDCYQDKKRKVEDPDYIDEKLLKQPICERRKVANVKAAICKRSKTVVP